ncbi:hypothetical protein EIKCOROL_02245 [Eikenella corrodens ATCC 23834]|uniref:Uncharacterized protein n=1 Tax=Eikenella corrodens ATCC 23834 TaxID=546274 RepID=C0DXY4_EIKCO|nr:hypothetical protein EIKCOROL_02245 [Eikenella corrodens ATCC 23834]
MHGDGDAGGEDGVEEFGGVAQEGEVAAVQGFDVGGVAFDVAEGEVVFPLGLAQNAREHGDFGGIAAQDGFGIAQAGKAFGQADHADGAAVVAEGDEPEPYVAVHRVGGDEDFAAVETGVGDVVVDVGEVGFAHGQVGRGVEVEQAGEDASVAAGVEHEAGGEFVGFAVVGFHAEAGGVAAVVEGGNGVAEAHVRALFGGFSDQDFIEDSAAHLVGGAGAGGEFVGEVEIGVAAAPGEGGAVFKLEAGLGFYGGQEAGFFDEFHAVRQQAFADDEAGEMLFFEHAHGKAVFEQQGGGDCAGGAGADDGDIAGLGHVLVSLGMGVWVSGSLSDGLEGYLKIVG